jgi:toxin ParE1/3/4
MAEEGKPRTQALKIVWSAGGQLSLQDQLEYIAERNPSAAIALRQRIDSSTSRLSDFPDSGRPGRVPGTRELVVPRTRYIVIYRVESQQVSLIRLLHTSQRWPPDRR